MSKEYVNYIASGIIWDCGDVDGLEWSVSEERPELPDEISVPVPKEIIAEGKDAIEDFISDYITDATGFCHFGFSYGK